MLPCEEKMLKLRGCCVFALHEIFNTTHGLYYRYKYKYRVNISKAAGSDILGHVLKTCANQLANVSTDMFNICQTAKGG